MRKRITIMKKLKKSISKILATSLSLVLPAASVFAVPPKQNPKKDPDQQNSHSTAKTVTTCAVLIGAPLLVWYIWPDKTEGLEEILGFQKKFIEQLNGYKNIDELRDANKHCSELIPREFVQDFSCYRCNFGPVLVSEHQQLVSPLKNLKDIKVRFTTTDGRKILRVLHNYLSYIYRVIHHQKTENQPLVPMPVLNSFYDKTNVTGYWAKDIRARVFMDLFESHKVIYASVFNPNIAESYIKPPCGPFDRAAYTSYFKNQFAQAQ